MAAVYSGVFWPIVLPGAAGWLIQDYLSLEQRERRIAVKQEKLKDLNRQIAEAERDLGLV